ncbi:putative serine/threonine-protein kinase PRKY [Lithobates pipiens]
MEYLNGGTLKTFVQKRKPLDKDTMRFIAAELLCAIQFLHSRDIAHGDIYTDNILFDSSGHVKIIDFGMPKILKHSTCEPESAKDFHNRRNALQRDFMFFLQCNFSDVRSQGHANISGK